MSHDDKDIRPFLPPVGERLTLPEGSWEMNLVCCTDVLLQDIGTPEATQNDVAITYAMAVSSAFRGVDNPDWGVINAAIQARWGTPGLDRIKKRAADLLNGLPIDA